MSSGRKSRDIAVISIMGGLVWASFAPLSMLFGVYLRSLGLTYGTIGMILTAGNLLSSVPQVIFGAVADRIGRRRTVMSLSLLARTATSLMMFISTDVPSMSIWYVATSFLLSGFTPLAQSMVADLSGRDELGRSMARYRLFGSAGWVISCVLTGLFAKEAMRSIFLIASVLSLLAFLVSIALSDVVKKANQNLAVSEEGESETTRGRTMPFIISVFLAGLSMGATSSFLTLSLTDLGGDALFLGVIIATGAVAEIPAMYLGGLLSDHIGGFSVLAIGETLLAGVYWLYGIVKDLYMYVLVQGLRGIAYSLFTISGMSISSGLGGTKRGSLFAGLYGLAFSSGMAAGPYLGGLLSDSFGLWVMFLISSFVSILSVAFVIPFIIAKVKRTE